MKAFALGIVAFVLQDGGAAGKMMTSVAGVEVLGKKAMPGLPDQRGTARFFHRWKPQEIIFPRPDRGSHTQKASFTVRRQKRLLAARNSSASLPLRSVKAAYRSPRAGSRRS
jgi:hypothetical protein